MARKSGYVRRHGVMRRETLWFTGVAANTTLAASGAAAIVTSLNAAALALRPFTIIRTRGRIGITSDQGAATEIQDAAYGLCVVSDEAVAVGVTAVPTPTASSGSDLWFTYMRLMGRLTVDTNVGSDAQGLADVQEVDSKAARKVEEGQDVVEVVESDAGISFGCIVRSFSRMLIKLH